MASLQHIGVLAHPLRPQTAPLAEQIAAYLAAREIDRWMFTRWEEITVQPRVPGSDLVIAIGGDGAMLRAARACAPHNVPVLGVNMGQLGFLTEISAGDWRAPLEGVLNGHYWVETRMMLTAELLRGETVMASGHALNDVVISRGVAPRTIWLEAYIDRDWTTTYNADGLVIATATGSTAYALACGGPILPPELRNILIVPVAPHLSMERPIVLAEGSVVDVVAALDNTTEIVLQVDGTYIGRVEPGDRVRVQASPYITRFVRMRERNYFYRSLLDRLEPRLPTRGAPLRRQL
jgi:NAD+ kinase